MKVARSTSRVEPDRLERICPFRVDSGSGLLKRRLLWFSHCAAMAAEEDAWPRDKRSPVRTTSPSSPPRKSKTRRRRSKRQKASDLPPPDAACRAAATWSGRLSSGKMIEFVRTEFCLDVCQDNSDVLEVTRSQRRSATVTSDSRTNFSPFQRMK
jgi:hypothetical protein